jgi:putative transposase
MGYVKIWVHLVTITKQHQKILPNNIRYDIFDRIRANAKEKNIHLDFINGYVDHIHCLISLNSTQSIDKVVQLIKGESSHWINQNKLVPGKFEWQDDYFAVSVSESSVNKVREYIKNQENHHKKKSFAEEYEEFIKKYGFEKLGG